MDYTNKAIGLACEKGGYKWKIDCSMESILLDSLFWQSLGKAMGWSNGVMPSGRVVPEPSKRQFQQLEPQWKWQWHKFIDHLAEGKSTESFFETLLTNNTKQ